MHRINAHHSPNFCTKSKGGGNEPRLLAMP